ncbi:MAG: polysaccharide biosynthesis tyrosine autokinase [Syntrophaceae bacterium]
MGKMFDALEKIEKDRFDEIEEVPVKTDPEATVLDSMLVSFYESSSTVAEQFRRLRTHIFRERAEDPPRTILVTSALGSEGKSFIAANLAVTIATEYDSYALLVDCDLRNPSLSRWFGQEKAAGLSDYLLDKKDISELLIKTDIKKLSILSGGSSQENPVELIGSKKMNSLINDLKSRYEDRYIIFDSSPILATTEPSVLTKMVDGIVLVVRADSTGRDSVEQAMKVLDKNKIIGVVLNDVKFMTEAMHSRFFGTKYSYYYYQYGKPEEETKKGGFLGKIGFKKKN